MTVAEGAEHVWKQLADAQIAYAIDPERREFFGFASLHDLFEIPDANSLLPEYEAEECDSDEQFVQDVCNWQNAIIDAVNLKFRALVTPPTVPIHTLTDSELEDELARRRTRGRLMRHRIREGEVDVTEADGVETMQNQDSYWK